MKLFQLHTKQGLPITKTEAWDFLSDPANLSAITPDTMGFEILAGASMPMFKGQIIHYKVSPFPGIKTRWVTEITHLKPMEYFVDEQRFGPYALWHHKHFLKSHENGVIMEDLIDYKLPLGLLGQALHGMLVKKQLQKVFQFRYEKLKSLFGEIPNITPALQFTSI
ncbi:MAG: SRPBCC family protein [Bacteroidia bacterium]|nr:SRPBCC family protein [Bacteroidia bacterium]